MNEGYETYTNSEKKIEKVACRRHRHTANSAQDKHICILFIFCSFFLLFRSFLDSTLKCFLFVFVIVYSVCATTRYPSMSDTINVGTTWCSVAACVWIPMRQRTMHFENGQRAKNKARRNMWNIFSSIRFESRWRARGPFCTLQ